MVGGYRYVVLSAGSSSDLPPPLPLYTTTPLPHLQTCPSWRYSRSLVYVLLCRDSF